MENSRLQYLLDCFFANTSTPEEKEELMRALASNQYDEAVKSYIDQELDNPHPSYQLNDQRSAHILSAILSTTQSTPEKAKLVPIHRKWYWAAAAVLVITLGVMGWFISRPSSHPGNIAVAKPGRSSNKNDIAPGTSGAMLTLADGSVIVLDSAGDGKLASQGNINILKTGGAIKYLPHGNGNEMANAFNTIATPRCRQFQLLLEDGTKVWLNAESSIRFPASFDQKERHVDITGEAYFEVAKNAGRPFTVSVRGMEVKVLGTHFNINAYEDEPAINTTLLEGAVKVVNNNATEMLAPGQQARLASNGGIKLVKNVATSEIVAWKNELFFFHDTDLKNLMRQIARWYDVQIVLPQQETAVTFNGKISRKSNLSAVLKMLALTEEVDFSIDGKKVIVNL